MKKLIATLALSGSMQAAPLVLTDNQGRSITASVTGIVDGQVCVTKNDGKSFKIALVNLDEPSKKRAEAAAAKAPRENARVRLTARNGPMGSDTDPRWKSSWGSYDKDVYQSRSISVTVECTTGEGDATLQVQWIGSEAGKASNQGVVKVEKKPIVLKPGEPVTLDFAALFVESDAKYVALGERDRRGIKYTGWIARVISSEGTSLASQSSRPTLLTSYSAAAVANIEAP